jgi:Tfp pilus assembly protein FimV
MSEPVFLVALAIAATTAIMVAKMIAGAIGGRVAPHSELAEIKERLDQQAAALEDAQSSIASQASQLAEVQERLDFAERLLAQDRDRRALGPGGDRG